ncbi:MAG TPA: M50 family metallopeptidase [Bacteroidales bacterium]|nr:M50 family metallopeptidase [Bacteroidales bacterium]HPT01656.1 M50 family metallopeptidase [Bacteroidales bacterium]
MKDILSSFLNNRTLLFYILLAIALVLTRIPVIGKYFRIVNTMIHEAGHAFITLIVSGQVISINLFADTSGSITTKSKSRFSQFLIAFAGYPVSAIAGYMLMYLIQNQEAIYILFVMLSIVMILMILSIRNTYGFCWAGSFALLNILLIYFDNQTAIYIAAAFFSLIVLTDSLISSLILLAITYNNKKKAGDATNLHKITGIPAMVWAFIFVAISAFMVFLSVKHYFPPLNGLLSNL